MSTRCTPYLSGTTVIALDLEGLDERLVGIVLLDRGREPHRAQRPLRTLLEHIPEPRTEPVVLVDDERARVVLERNGERLGFVEPIGERLLADDMHARRGGAETALGVTRRRRQDVDEVE